jgi:hypothetical protein
MKVLVGLGMSLFHSDILSFLLLDDCEFSEANAILVAHVSADFALKPQGLFLGGFGEFSLKRIFLSAVAAFFSFVVAFAFRQCAAFTCLVQAYGVSLMLLAFWAVRGDFFGNIHVYRFPALQYRKHSYSYTFSVPQRYMAV